MSVQQNKFREIADKIREKTGETDLIKPSDFASKIDDVYTAGQNAGGGGSYEQGVADGKEAESRRRWEAHLGNMNTSGWTYGFAGKGVNDETFTPYTDIKMTAGYSLTGLFSYCGITDLKGIMERYGVSFDLSLGANAQNLFFQSKVTKIPRLLLASATSFQNAFASCADLTIIEELYAPKATSWSNTFQNCTSLEELRITSEIKLNGFNVSASTKLSYDSLMSIINALANKKNDTSGTEWVCTLGTENLNKLTNAEKAVATEKGWVLA